MKNHSTVVVGASGFIGSYLLEAFRADHLAVGTFSTNSLPGLHPLDIINSNDVRKFFDQHQPELVLCPAARPHVEECERDPVATRKVNIGGLANIVGETRRVHARMIYFSSEYVFDGSRGPYSELDHTNPINEYGRQKLEAETLISENLHDFMIVRLSAPYGWERGGKNFVMQLLHRGHKGEPIQVPEDQVITPTYICDFADAVHSLVKKGGTGIFHLAGSECMVRTDFARLVARTFCLPPQVVHPVPTSAMNLAAPRPRSAGLKTDKAAAALGHYLKSPREGLAAMQAEHAAASTRNATVPS